jgi:hypothetical protein
MNRSTNEQDSETKTLSVKATELPPVSDDDKRKVAYALNLCTVSVSQIIDYHDLYVLEQEYDSILNNLNIQNFIKDEPLLKVIKQILDTVTFFKIQEGDKIIIQREYQHKMKNAIWSAVPNPSIILAGAIVGGGAFSPATTAVAAVSQIGIGYVNYRKNKSQYGLENEKQRWELQRSAIEQFNSLRRELFEAAWRLSERYDFNDEYRLTEKQITHYNSILMDPDPLRRYERLDDIVGVFKAFPPYWYYLGNTAKEISESIEYWSTDTGNHYKALALGAYNHFDEIYVEFMREDVVAASCGLEHIALLDFTNEKDREKANAILEKIVKLAGSNIDVLQICAFNYVVLGEIDEATKVLKYLVNEDYNISVNGLLLSRIYQKHYNDRIRFDILEKRIGRENIMPWIEDDANAEIKYIECQKQDVLWRVDEFAKKVFQEQDKIYKAELKYPVKKRQRDKADWVLKTEFTKNLFDALNDAFDELLGSKIFEIQRRKDKAEWIEFFGRLADDTTSFVNENLYADENRLKDEISHNITQVYLYNAKDITRKIDAFYRECNLVKQTQEFRKALVREFNECFSLQSAASAEDIILILDEWYSRHEIALPDRTQVDRSAKDGLLENPEQTFLFFDYSEIYSEDDVVKQKVSDVGVMMEQGQKKMKQATNNVADHLNDGKNAVQSFGEKFAAKGKNGNKEK